MVERVGGLTHAQWNRKWEKEGQDMHQNRMLKVWILLNITFFFLGLFVGYSL